MKKFTVFALLASTSAIAGQTVTVNGVGSTTEEARMDALYQASMRVCPSAVVNDREYRSQKVFRDTLIVYNGCIVKNYKVNQVEPYNNLVRVSISAEVEQNRLPDRILKQHTNWFFYDFEQHKDNIAQLKFRYNNAQSLVSEVFYDYPTNAYEIASNSKIKYNGYSSVIEIDYSVTWNKNFLNALQDMFSILQDHPSSEYRPSLENIKIDRPVFSDNYGFDQKFIPIQVHTLLASNHPMVRLRMIDHSGKEYLNVCRTLNHVDNLYDLHRMFWLKFTSFGVVKDKMIVPLDSTIPDSAELKIDLVTQSFCKQLVY